MEKISTYAELLYQGFVLEKLRCKSHGVWKIGYKSILIRHITFLRRVLVRMAVPKIEGEDTQIILDFFKMCKDCPQIGKYYSPVMNKATDSFTFTELDKSRYNENINMLMMKMVDDLLAILKTKPLDKTTCYMLIRALHNLPRYYLSEDSETLFCLQQSPISYDDAINYSFSNMNDISKEKYQNYCNF